MCKQNIADNGNVPNQQNNIARNDFFEYDNKQVYIVFNDDANEPFFHAKQMCKLLGYANPTNAFKRHVEKKNIFYLKDIVSTYKILHKNVQGHTTFLNKEQGRYLSINIRR